MPASVQRVSSASSFAAATCAVAAMCVTSPARGAEVILAQPSACAIGEELAFRAERALGRPLSEAGASRCTVHVAQDGGALSALLEIAGPGQTPRSRSFRAPTCEELTDTLALAVVLAIGSADEASSNESPGMSVDAAAPNLGESGVAPSDRRGADTGSLLGGAPGGGATGGGATEDRARDRGATDSSVGAAPGAGSELHGSLAAALVVDAGSLPALGIGPALSGAIGSGSFEARATATWLPAREEFIDASSGSSAGAEIGLVTGALLACMPHLPWLSAGSSLELGACAGAELGWISGSGVGVNAPDQQGALWSAARLDLAGRYGLGPSGLRAELTLSGVLPIERHEFVVDGEPMHRPAPFVARVGVGLTLDLD